MRRIALIAALLCAPLVTEAQSTLPFTISTGSGELLSNVFGASISTSDPVLTAAQTFQVPFGSLRLNQWTFQLYSENVSNQLQFSSYIMAWDGTKPVGPVLTPTFTFAGSTTPGYWTRTFDVAGVVLTPGAQYVALLSTTATAPQLRQANLVAPVTFIGPYSNGQQASLAQSYTPGQTTPWTGLRSDLVFTATFAIVPEPSTYAMMAAGMLVIGVAARSRRSR